MTQLSASAGTNVADAASLSRVCIVVCSHRVCFPLDRCLQSLVREVRRPADLVFVANGDEDHVAAWARERFRDITLLELASNRHYCGGYNAGIRWAMARQYDYVLLVNADTEVASPGFLRRLTVLADSYPRAAFVGPKVFYHSLDEVQRTVLRYPSFWRHLWGWPAHRLFPRRPQADGAREVEFLNGVCVLCRLSALREIGLLDEVMGGYTEDADWSWRARQTGLTSMYVAEPSVIHYEERNGYEHYSLKTFMLKRNTVYWLAKSRAFADAWGYAVFSLALAAARAGWATLRRRQGVRHREFCVRLARAYWGILARRPVGEWFGPPMGPW